MVEKTTTASIMYIVAKRHTHTWTHFLNSKIYHSTVATYSRWMGKKVTVAGGANFKTKWNHFELWHRRTCNTFRLKRSPITQSKQHGFGTRKKNSLNLLVCEWTILYHESSKPLESSIYKCYSSNDDGKMFFLRLKHLIPVTVKGCFFIAFYLEPNSMHHKYNKLHSIIRGLSSKLWSSHWNNELSLSLSLPRTMNHRQGMCPPAIVTHLRTSGCLLVCTGVCFHCSIPIPMQLQVSTRRCGERGQTEHRRNVSAGLERVLRTGNA